MKNSSDRRQLINNELLARSVNQKAKRVIKTHTPEDEQSDLHINFYCECSDDNCRQRISLSLEEYEKLHAKEAFFVILKGHETPQVEKVRKSKRDALLVEKYSL